MTEGDDNRPPMATPRVAAGVLFRDAASRILLVKPTYKDGWELPGGYVEPGETPHAAAVREVHEELGVRLPVGAARVIDWAPHPKEGDKLLLIFDGGTLDDYTVASLQPDGDEISAIEFYPLTSLPDVAPDRLARRIAMAATSEACQYAEHGVAHP